MPPSLRFVKSGEKIAIRIVNINIFCEIQRIETSEKQTKSYSKNEEQDKHKLQRYVTKAADREVCSDFENQNRVVKRTRAQGGCLGTKSRRKT